MKTINAVMDVTVETEVRVVQIKKSLSGQPGVLLEVEGGRKWLHEDDTFVITLNSKTERRA